MDASTSGSPWLTVGDDGVVDIVSLDSFGYEVESGITFGPRFDQRLTTLIAYTENGCASLYSTS